MAKRRAAITGETRLLYAVPKHAIVDFLVEEVDGDDLSAAYKRAVHRNDSVSRAKLAELSVTDLLRVFASCNSLSVAAARDLHEEYRYRGMKSLYLYECEALPPRRKIDLDALNTHLADREQELAQSSYPGFSKLQAKSVDKIPVGPFRIEEIRYAYQSIVHYIDPATEYPKVVDDLRSGFLWIERKKKWVAVCARDEAIEDVLTASLTDVTGTDLRRTAFPKVLLQQLEQYQDIRRAAFKDPRTNTTRRISNPRLREDTQALEEVKAHDQRDERMSSGYNQMLDGGVGFALGYTSSRGRIFLSRDLTAQQLRKWGPAKIEAIIQGIRGLRASSPAAIAASYATQFLHGFSTDERKAVVEIAEAVIRCRTNSQSEESLSENSLSLRTRLGTLVDVVILAYSEDDDEAIDLRCGTCESSQLDVKDNAITCKQCDAHLTKNGLRTFDGHRPPRGPLTECVQLVPSQRLLSPFSSLLAAVTGVPFDIDREFFHIRGRRLHYSRSSTTVEYRLAEIPEFAALIRQNLPPPVADPIRTALGTFKEKCRRMSHSNCNGCVANRVAPNCFLRLFGLVDPQYTPRPHHGHEFGDYDRTITIDGSPGRQMVIMMKSGKPDGKPIRHRDSAGKDISTQFSEYLRDAAKDLIGICVPQPLEAGFRAHMRWLAGRAGKKVVFLTVDELIQLTEGAMRQHGIALNDL